MPPALSDDEKSSLDSEPGRSKRGKKPTKSSQTDAKVEDMSDDDDVSDAEPTTNGAGDNDEEEDDDELDLEEDEYIVERILSHYIDDEDVVKYEVKWEGFEAKKDRTFEPEENLATATVALEEYWNIIGGRDKLYEDTAKAVRTKKRGRPGGGSGGASKRRKNGEHPSEGDVPASLKAKVFKPPSGSWEDAVDLVDMYRDENGALMVYLTWKSGDKTQHAARQAYLRCPQKILNFYESKINFKAE